MHFGVDEEEDYRVPCVDEVLSQCSKIQDIEWDERSWQRSTLSSERAATERTDLSSITRLMMFLNVSKEAFLWIWANASSKISKLHVSYITLASARQTYFSLMQDLDHQEMFFMSDIRRMFDSNPMGNMSDFGSQMCLQDIKTARYFVDMFRKNNKKPLSIDKLYIKIELMQTDLVPETLERVAQEMKMFEKYCKELKKKTPTTRVQYYFVRIGRVRNYIDWHGNVHPAGDWDFN